MAAKIVFITEGYFVKNAGFVEMLNMGDVAKKVSRLYLAICAKYNDNSFYVPLRKYGNF